jgi:predicted nucleotidyltransferase
VLVWPDRATVDAAAREWAAKQVAARPGVLRVGYFGSYARGDWGVGSDLDIVVVVSNCNAPFGRRCVDWDTASLPVPADLLIFDQQEWRRVLADGSRFGRTLGRETVWVYAA